MVLNFVVGGRIDTKNTGSIKKEAFGLAIRGLGKKILRRKEQGFHL